MIFINYRRIDTSTVCQMVKELLSRIFPSTHIFLDIGTIQSGDYWKNVIETNLDKSDVLLSVIGTNWLTASDKYGLRLIDKENDWVRKEIEVAITKNKIVIPMLIDLTEVPPVNVLPKSIDTLFDRQVLYFSTSNIIAHINPLIEVLEQKLNLSRNLDGVVLPHCQIVLPEILNEEEINKRLETLPFWQIIKSEIPGKVGQYRIEIMRTYKFHDFLAVMKFMNEAKQKVDTLNHHPRWENIWINLTVFMSTIDRGYKLTSLDFEIATYLDGLFNNYQ